MLPRPQSPSGASSDSSTSTLDRYERPSNGNNTSYSGRLRRTSLDSPYQYRQSPCSGGCSSSSSTDAISPLLHAGPSHGSGGPSAAAPSSSSSPWTLDSLVHLTRRAARQLTFSTSVFPSADHAGYLPLHFAKQRLSLDREKNDEMDDVMSRRERCNCRAQQRRMSHHDQEHYHPPSSSRNNCCLPSSPPATTLGVGAHSTRRCFVLASLIKIAVLALALVGVATLVGLATGILQRTPMYTEKALQDAGWARRPITLSRQLEKPGHTAQMTFSRDPYTGVTVHDFSPQTPLLSLPPGDSASHPTVGSSTLSTAHPPSVPISSDALHLLILCPLRNSAPDLPHLFELLDGLAHPSVNTSLGFLVGDEDDDTGDVLHRLVQERANREDHKRYRHITLLHKDFNLQVPSGANRHSYPVQLQRRSVMARARTYLLTATLEPTVDWVLWIDSDIAEVSPTLFQDLLLYGKAGVVETSSGNSGQNALSDQVDEGEWNDVIIPNAMKRLPDGNLLGFDMNNWAETADSLKAKADLAPDHLLIEGNIWQHMRRIHLADQYTPYTTALASVSAVDSKAVKHPGQPEIFSSDPSYVNSLPETDQRLNISSPAYIGRLQPLDGIGGVAALVRAEVHRMGAIFPSWIFENQLETEAFGVLAKRLGARVVGLPNLFVLHCE